MIRTLLAAITAINSLGAFGAEAIEEIVVMAQRRAESIQEVPLAVSAFTGEFVRDTNLDDIKDLVRYTPGITGNSKDSFIDTLSIRGIVTNDFGVGGDPSVGVFKNNLYQGRNGEVVTSLYDLDRAEVLRGPQGFLFGRNSISGAISVFTKRPEFAGHEGYASLDVGERGHVLAEGAVNLPVNDSLSFRVAGYHSQEDGYVDNQAIPEQNKLIAHDKSAGRLSARYENDAIDLNLMIEYEHREQSGSMYRATQKGATWDDWIAAYPDIGMPNDNRDISSDMSLGEEDNGNILSIGLQADWDLGFAMLSSLTGYKDHEFDYAEDFDATSEAFNDYAQNQNGEYFEQELRLVSQGSDPLSWYAGVSVYKEKIDALFSQRADEDVVCTLNDGDACDVVYPGFTTSPVGLLEQNRDKGDYDGWASYVDLTYTFNDAFDASLGVRYTYDEKHFKINALPVESELGPILALGFTTDGFLPATKSWDEFTPRMLVRYRPDDDWMVFGSVTRGYKSGGFGSFALSPDQPFGSVGVTRAEASPDDFNPETVWSYEIGTKGELLDGRMRLAGNMYYYTYEDLQVNVPGTGGGIAVGNVGTVDGWGIEGTLEWIATDNIDLYLTSAYADSEVSDAEALCDGSSLCDGQPLPQVPEYSGSAVVNLHIPAREGDVVFSAELYGQTRTYGGLLQTSEGINDAYADLTLRGGYRATGGWSAIAYMENVTNEVYYDGVSDDGGFVPAHYFGPSRPRTVGLRMSWDF